MGLKMSQNKIKRDLYDWKLLQNRMGQKYLQGTIIENQKFEYKQIHKTGEIIAVNVFDDFAHFYTQNAIYECRYSNCKQITEPLRHYPQMIMRIELALNGKELKENKKLIAKQNEIFERVINAMSDKTREELLKQDDEYKSLEEKRSEMEDRILLNFSEAMEKVKDYISLVQETNMRFADVSYMAAVKDTISLMSSLGFLDK